MTKMEKNNLYDELSIILTEFEELTKNTTTNQEDILYTELVKLQRHWDEITGDDE